MKIKTESNFFTDFSEIVLRKHDKISLRNLENKIKFIEEFKNNARTFKKTTPRKDSCNFPFRLLKLSISGAVQKALLSRYQVQETV